MIQFFEDQSPTVNAALRLQTRCSEKVVKDSNESAISTRVLVPSSQVGCLIGKGGALISEMRSVTKASIRIFQGENVPRIARENEEMVQVRKSWHLYRLMLLDFVCLRETKTMFFFFLLVV